LLPQFSAAKATAPTVRQCRARGVLDSIFKHNPRVGPNRFCHAGRRRPDADVPAVFAVVAQVKWGIAGLVLSMLILAWILSRFIRKHPVPPLPAPAFKSESWHL